MVVFAPQSLIMDPPFTKLDILSCRNLMIYLTVEMQKKLIRCFTTACGPGGILFLGSAETVGSFTDLFEALDRKRGSIGEPRRPRRRSQSIFPRPSRGVCRPGPRHR